MSGDGTHWATCRFPSSSGDIAHPWVLRHSPSGGYSAFATRAFNAGDVILVERALTCIEAHHPFSPEDVVEIERRVKLLSESERDAFYALANVFSEDEGVTASAGIYMTNCFDMTGREDGRCASAIYPAIARLNHSCTPNAQQVLLAVSPALSTGTRHSLMHSHAHTPIAPLPGSQTHLPETGEEVLIASRAIAAGEEINDCYIDLRADCVSRRALLRELYRFDCCCAACSLPQGPQLAADDRARRRAAELEDMVVSAADISAAVALDVACDLVRLLEAPGSSGWAARYVAGAHVSAYLLRSALGDGAAARRHLQSAHAHNCLLQGEASPDAKHTLALMQAHR